MSAEGARLFERMAELGPQDVGDERAAKNIADLAGRFRAATAEIEARQFKRPDGSSVSVHELPWYVVIGAPDSGNSSALENSGLGFPLMNAENPPQVTGVGGTRYCEWWFSDEAVFLDTAGRYVAHETRNLKDSLAGSASWHAFLGLLKQHRPEKPINGAIVTISVTDLLLWAKPERQQFAAHVRMRLSELYAGLGTRFPIYLMVTKMDLLAGFIEFFGAMDDAERAQVWGTTFDPDIDPADVAKRYTSDFAILQERLYAEMLHLLEREPDLARRASIYRFPQQFHAIGPLLQEILTMAFSMHVDHHPMMLRGVYFISATQAGKPIDRVMRTLERAFKVEHREVEATGPGKSFFLTRLLREVIFPEAHLASDDLAARDSTGRSPATILPG
jgi:type VI secretion system protein ImpL